MVHAVVWNVLAWFVDIIKWDAFAEVVFYHFVHKSSVLLFVLVVAFHFSLQVLEALFGHWKVPLQSYDRFLAGHWDFVMTVIEVLAVCSCVYKLFVFTEERNCLLTSVKSCSITLIRSLGVTSVTSVL